MTEFRLNRVFSEPLTKLLLPWPVTPNMVTLFSLFLGLSSGWLFSRGHAQAQIAGALCYQMAVVLDNCDGEIARAKKQGSAFGAWLDVVADFITDVSLFLGVAIGTARAGSSGPVLLFAILCLSGSLLHFLLVILEKTKGFGPAAFGSPNPDQKARRGAHWIFFDALREGDSSWFVILLAFTGHSDWLLWCGGIYMQVLWLSAAFLNFRWIIR